MPSFTTVPYSHLSTDPLPLLLCNGLIQVSLSLPSSNSPDCLLSLPSHFYFDGEDRSSTLSLKVGCTFQLEYREHISEIRLGRPFSVRDA
jgi:hypothetical protein